MRKSEIENIKRVEKNVRRKGIEEIKRSKNKQKKSVIKGRCNERCEGKKGLWSEMRKKEN